MYDWIVYLHVIAGFTFFLSHGATAAVSFKIRSEDDPSRIKTLLELTAYTTPVMFIALLLLLVAGIVAGFMGDWWGDVWIWLALGLLLGISVYMGVYTQRTYSPLRKALGLEYYQGMRDNPKPPEEPLSDAEIREIASKITPTTVTIVGYVIPLFIIWLMIFKPF